MWADYLATLKALTAVAGELSPERSGRLITTPELAERLGVCTRTIGGGRKRGSWRRPSSLVV